MRVKCQTTCSTKDTISDTYPIDYGTPQGSCLGPLIFLILYYEIIYLMSNPDMSLHITDVDLIQFAENTTLLFGHRNRNYLKYCIEHEFENLPDWLYANKLTLNVEKSVYMLFEKVKTNRDFRITVCDKEIPRCTSAKFLGTWLDDKLNWNMHVKKLLSKLKSGLGMMRRANKYLTDKAKRMLYYGQVHSNLSYGISIWGPMLWKGQVQGLLAIQHKCVDLIGNQSSFKEYKIPTLQQLIILEQCKLGFKLCKKLLPLGLEKLMLTDHKMTSIEKSHAYPTRSKKVPNRPSAKLSLYRNSFLYSSIKHFSELSAEIRESKTLHAFVRKCKKMIFNS